MAMTDLDRRHLELRVDPVERRPETHVSLAWVAVTVFVILAVLAYATSRAAAHRDVSTLATPAPGGHGQLLGAPHPEGAGSVRPGSGDGRRAVGGVPQPAVAQAAPLTGSVLALSGWATWFDTTPGTAAAGPDLRAWLGDWRGQTVKVCHNGCIYVVLTDWCQCPDRSGTATLIDLAKADFAVLGDPSAGVLSVTVSRGGAIALPATDVEER